jgi:branched-subunit amino acid transport protein
MSMPPRAESSTESGESVLVLVLIVSKLLTSNRSNNAHYTMINCLAVLPAVLIALLCPSVFAMDAVVLSERVLKLSLAAAELSSLAYEENPPSGAFSHFGFFDNEPDQAIVAQTNGYCYAAYRGTTLTWDDWKQFVIF